MITKRSYITKVKQIFKEIDTDMSGTITLKEFHNAMKDERMEAYLEALGIQIHHADVLFRLLDDDGGGCVDIDEFLSGAVRFHGEAKALDLAVVQAETKSLKRSMNRLFSMLGKCEALRDGFAGK